MLNLSFASVNEDGFSHFRCENRVKEGLNSPGRDVEVEEAAAAPPSSESLDSSPVRSNPFFLNSYIWVDCVFLLLLMAHL